MIDLAVTVGYSRVQPPRAPASAMLQKATILGLVCCMCIALFQIIHTSGPAMLPAAEHSVTPGGGGEETELARTSDAVSTAASENDPVLLGVASELAALAGLMSKLRVDTTNNTAAAEHLLALVGTLDSTRRHQDHPSGSARSGWSADTYGGLQQTISTLMAQIELLKDQIGAHRRHDGLQEAYLQTALEIQHGRGQHAAQQRRRQPSTGHNATTSTEVDRDGTPGGAGTGTGALDESGGKEHLPCDLMVMISTANRGRPTGTAGARPDDIGGFEYLDMTLASIQRQHEVPGTKCEVCVLVVKVDGPAAGLKAFEEMQRRAWDRAKKPIAFRVRLQFLVVNNFDDPYPEHLVQNGAEHKEAVATSMKVRRQGLHLSHALLETSRWQANHILIMEDDMPFCNASGYGSVIDALRETAAMCNQGSTDWSMIRVGFGGNGILIHWNDAIGLGNYLLKHMARRPIDWLIPEWAASTTFAAVMINGHRRPFTYRHNVYKHIGMNSLFDGRYWAGSESNVLPGCYALNTFLRPEETFLKLICRTDPVSPCWCVGEGKWCHEVGAHHH